MDVYEQRRKPFMNFQNGEWVLKKGITATFAQAVNGSKFDGNKLTVYAWVRPDMARYTLGGPMLTLELTAPANNVIGVRVTHFKGTKERRPEYELNSETADVSCIEDDQTLIFKSGELEARFAKFSSDAAGQGGWDLSFYGDGKYLTRSGNRSIAYYLDDRGATQLNDFGAGEGSRSYIQQQLDLQVGECLYGLGERFGPFVKNGQSIDMWMADGGTGSEQAYKNVPFYFSNKGYGIFVNSPSDVNFELATVKVERACFTLQGESMQYYVIYGKSPKDILERYTFLTGRPALPPAWSFGLWLSTSFLTDYDEKTVTSFIEGMAQRDIPLHVFHFDCYWMKGNHWVDFEWDDEQFPDPKGMLERYKKRGLRICVWINPYIAQQSRLFDEAAEKGYLIKKTDGSVWQTDMWQSGMGIVDFTNPDARKWYQSKLEGLMDMGVDCFKTDFGERIPVRDVAYYDGSDPLKMHNYYTHLYNKTVFEVIERKRGKGDAVVFARSGTAGTQQFPVHWGGDNSGTYPSMAETLRAGLSLALSGYGFWSHDIGGFEATATADLYKRWCALGLFSSHSRLHGSSSYRVPWTFDDEASEVLRHFVKLKCKLMPYIYAQAIYAHKYGAPILRPMVFEFPTDPAVSYLDQQYMFGDSIMVAPIFNSEGIVTFYVPHGKWTGLLNGKIYEGGRYYTETHDYFSLPVLVRASTLLPLGSEDDRPDYDYTKDLTVRIYELENDAEASVDIPTAEGTFAARITAIKREGKITVTSTKTLPGLTVEIGDKRYNMTGKELVIEL